MSSSYNEDNLDIDDSLEDEDSSPKGLRRAANKAKKYEAELAAALRKLAFYEAGIPLDDPKMNYFVKGYDGDLDPVTIRSAAVSAGFMQDGQAQDRVQAQENIAAQDRVSRASAGAMPEDVTESAAFGRLEAAMEEGGVDAMLEVARQYGIPIASEQ